MQVPTRTSHSMGNERITPGQVKDHNRPSEGYLCPLKANHYEIEFLEFEVRDTESKEVFYKVFRERPESDICLDDLPPEAEDEMRHVRYTFPTRLLRCKSIGTRLVFAVGPKLVPGLRIVERHYFQGSVVREFDMSFGFCIPGSTNSWDAEYSMPLYSEEQVTQFAANPGGHMSDTFYFVGDELVMHNKATYTYTE